ncbi:hypothetical protein FSC37_22115 [Piscinibacter aquaticus]|uniref:Lysoplasmalogenase n=1 Tax=Piscinibacter aquaticus TaxID=392597 RepID=A0A5C6U6P2_9BURK|nr:hypothetical protein FSC37_22115 [Piscinibacter aquaticus]
MLPLAIALTATVAIAAGLGLLPAAALFVAKPLTTVLLIVHAARRGADEPVARRWILVGLVLSLAGDIALLWPKQGFLPGLIAFLLAHWPTSRPSITACASRHAGSPSRSMR